MASERLSKALEAEIRGLVNKWLTVSPETHRRQFRQDLREFARTAMDTDTESEHALKKACETLQVHLAGGHRRIPKNATNEQLGAITAMNGLIDVVDEILGAQKGLQDGK